MWRIHLLIVGLSAFSLSSNATDLAGTVEELSGKPASGTFVTAELNGRAMSVSVVTDAEDPPEDLFVSWASDVVRNSRSKAFWPQVVTHGDAQTSYIPAATVLP